MGGGSQPVLCVFAASAHGYPRVLQGLTDVIICTKRLRHPSIVSLIGVTTDPLQIIVEWMPNRGLVEYLEEHPEASRIGLVSPVLFAAFD